MPTKSQLRRISHQDPEALVDRIAGLEAKISRVKSVVAECHGKPENARRMIEDIRKIIHQE